MICKVYPKRKNEITIPEREYFKLQSSKEMLDRVMHYLDRKHFNIYRDICHNEIAIMKKDINELKELTCKQK